MRQSVLRAAGCAALFAATAILFSSCGPARKPKSVTPPPPVIQSVPGTALFYHTVARKQTLYRIAKMYGVDMRELMRVNGIKDASKLETGQKLLIPGHSPAPITPMRGSVYTPEQIRGIIGPKDMHSVWHTITVHHSGTLQGGASAFNRDHLRRRMGGLFYHFVIGNGSQSREGQIEVGWRWRRHVKANRPYDIQICVVGDFNRQQVTESQFSSLVALVQTLRHDYNVPIENIRRHEDIPGKHTACPGAKFPFNRLISTLRQNS